MITGIVMFLLALLMMGVIAVMDYYIMLVYGSMVFVLIGLLINYRFRGILTDLYFVDGVSLNLILLSV
jgi:hypothetical protein